MFGLHGRDTFNKPTSGFGHIVNLVKKWWIKLFQYTLLVLFFGVVGIIGYTWHTYLYNIDVTDFEKQQYIVQKNKEVTFKKDKFDNIKSIITLRAKSYNEDRVEYRDIFYIEKFGSEEE